MGQPLALETLDSGTHGPLLQSNIIVEYNFIQFVCNGHARTLDRNNAKMLVGSILDTN